MNTDKIQTVAVIGAGVMGRQIALHTALHAFEEGGRVFLCSRSEESAERAKQWVQNDLEKKAAKGRITQQEAEKAKERLKIVTSLEEALKEADLILESIVENIDAKRALLAEVSRMCAPDALIGTNSSNMVSSRMADVTLHPERLLNIHYLNPVFAMEVVEVVRGPHTSEAAAAKAEAFVRQIGKIPVVLQKEIAGFVVNRINAAVTHEACALVEQGIASVEDIDLACEKGLHYPMGPFRLMDLIGIDVHYAIRADRYAESGDEYDAPSRVVIEKVKKGEFGRKTGKGWYTYPDTEKK